MRYCYKVNIIDIEKSYNAVSFILPSIEKTLEFCTSILSFSISCKIEIIPIQETEEKES